MAAELDERARRIWAATEAKAAGRGGIALVSRATGISLSTIARGLKELEAGETTGPGRVRRPGGGRRPLLESDLTLLVDLEGLVEPTASGRRKLNPSKDAALFEMTVPLDPARSLRAVVIEPAGMTTVQSQSLVKVFSIVGVRVSER